MKYSLFRLLQHLCRDITNNDYSAILENLKKLIGYLNNIPVKPKEVIIIKQVIDLAIFVLQNSNAQAIDGYREIIAFRDKLDLPINNLNDLIKSLYLPRISFDKNRLVRTSIYETVEEVNTDVKKVVSNRYPNKPEEVLSLKWAYIYYISLIILNALEEHPELESFDLQFVELLELVTQNEVYIYYANSTQKEINKTIKYAVTKLFLM